MGCYPRDLWSQAEPRNKPAYVVRWLCAGEWQSDNVGRDGSLNGRCWPNWTSIWKREAGYYVTPYIIINSKLTKDSRLGLNKYIISLTVLAGNTGEKLWCGGYAGRVLARDTRSQEAESATTETSACWRTVNGVKRKLIPWKKISIIIYWYMYQYVVCMHVIYLCVHVCMHVSTHI